MRGTASQRLTAESAAPAASVCSMECFMTSHACLALPLPSRFRCRCSHMLPCYRTQLLSLKQVPSRRPTHFHHMSSEVSRSFAWRPASEQMMIRNEGMCIAPWLISMLLASVLPLVMPDTKMRPRGGRFYRPPTAAPLRLKPDEHFQPLWWLKLAGPGGHWLAAWPRRAQYRHCVWLACGAIGGATETHGDLW